MKLKQEDRDLLHEFFCAQSVWMKENSLLNSKNLNEFKKRFLDFEKSKNCEENLACKLFEFALEHELLKCEERNLTAVYNADVKKGIKKVKLNYVPIVKPATDNPSILLWVNEAKIVYEVPASRTAELNRSIQKKLDRNAAERRASYEAAKDFIVR